MGFFSEEEVVVVQAFVESFAVSFLQLNVLI